MNARSNLLIAGLILACTFMVFAEENDNPPLKFMSGGYVYWENSRLGKADYNGGSFKGDWFSSILAGLVLENAIGEQLKTRVALEAKTYRPFPEEDTKEASRFTKFSTYIHEAKAVYSFGNRERFPMEMEVGYFLYDYNRDQRNLGEYLFRSQIYPCNLFVDFELPMDKLLGIRFGNSFFDNTFHQDLILNSEYKFYPKSDFSLSYLADYTIANVLKIGAGVCFHHVIPVLPKKVTPETENNTYVQIAPQTWYDSEGTPHVIDTAIEGLYTIINRMDSISYQDSISEAYKIYPEIEKTETHFSYRGVKCMAMLSFDIKPLFGSPAFFGEDDLKIYAEAAILGVKDYPFLYDNILERIPVMIGFNVPFFNILDIFAIEVEYYGYKLPNDWENMFRNGIPHPGSVNFPYTTWDKDNYKDDDWKWSVYLRKTILRGLSISCQVARDHLRLPDQYSNTYQTIMKHKDNWWLNIRVTAKY